MTASISWSRLRKSATWSKDRNLWPEPELSIGTWYRTMGSSECWEAVGQAREMFITLSKEIKVLLEKRSEYLGKSEPIPHSITFGMYMIGRKKESANPTIIFSCKQVGPRKRAREIIKESEVLNNYPGVKLGDTTYPPEFDQAPKLLAIDDVVIDTSGMDEVKKTVLCHSSGDLCGRQIFVRGYNGSDTSLRKATTGAIFVSQRKYLCLTVAHAFREAIGHVDETDFDFDLDGDDRDTDDEEHEFAVTTSRGSLTPSYTDSDETRVLEEPQSDVSSDSHNSSGNLHRNHDKTLGSIMEIEPHIPDIEIQLYKPGSADAPYIVLGDLFKSSIDRPCAGRDWALIEIKDPQLWTFNKIPLANDVNNGFIYPRRVRKLGSVNAPVLAITGFSGLLSGTLLGSPTFIKSPDCQDFQEVWTVRLNGKLSSGDCGSWVFDAKTGSLYGHIISGSPLSGVAHIIPAFQVFEDIEQCLGDKVKFPARHKFQTEKRNFNFNECIPYTLDEDMPSSFQFKEDMPSSFQFKARQRPILEEGPNQINRTLHHNYRTQTMPFEPTAVHCSLSDTENVSILPDIKAKITTGIFRADNDWACYRRNHFTLICWFNLSLPLTSRDLVLKQSPNLLPERILAFGMCISSRTSGEGGKPIELLQYQPRGKHGIIHSPQVHVLLPQPVVNVGLMSGFTNLTELNVVTFDHIQFKKATANNGKKGAAQQYFHILVELYARVSTGKRQSKWIKVASRSSAPLIVRGRSPAHYQDERSLASGYSSNSLISNTGSGYQSNSKASNTASGFSSDNFDPYDSFDPSDSSSVSSLGEHQTDIDSKLELAKEPP